MSGKHYAFFENRECEFYPCHKGVEEGGFNCLFCYCPLYALGEDCGGTFHYNSDGTKSCMDCAFPHRRENYAEVIRRCRKLIPLAAKRGGK